jgi:hypothetical protein
MQNSSDIELSTNQPLPDGPAWACILASAIGCAAFGALVDLAEASKSISGVLNLYRPSGDLSGKSVIAIVIWAIAWGALHVRWKNHNVRSPGMILVIAVILIVLALIALFPPFFELFAAA